MSSVKNCKQRKQFNKKGLSSEELITVILKFEKIVLGRVWNSGGKYAILKNAEISYPCKIT